MTAAAIGRHEIGRRRAASREAHGGERVDEHGGAEGEPEHEHRDGARARSQRQRGARGPVAQQGVHERRRIADRVDADPQHDTGRHEGDGEPAVRSSG